MFSKSLVTHESILHVSFLTEIFCSERQPQQTQDARLEEKLPVKSFSRQFNRDGLQLFTIRLAHGKLHPSGNRQINFEELNEFPEEQ